MWMTTTYLTDKLMVVLHFKDQNSEQVYSNIVVSTTFDIVETGYLSVFDSAYSPGPLSGRANISFTGVNTEQFNGVDGTTSSGFTGITRYFWDDFATPDSWELCPFNNNGGDENDCNQSSPGVFVVGSNSVTNRVRKVTLRADFNIDLMLQFDYTLLAPSYLSPTSTDHAKITATFPAGNATIVGGLVYYDYEQDDSYDNSFDSADNTSGLKGTIFPAAIFSTFDIRLDYFPELPVWAGRNENNWNSSIMLAYDDDFKPDGSGICTPGIDCLDAILRKASPNNNIVALLIHASAIPVDSAGLETIFEGENNVPDEQRIPLINTIFNAKPNLGDDFILILEDIPNE
jgi:hypothetical protein